MEYDLAPGIDNVGNTCFHNSAAQFFYRIIDLRNVLIQNKSNYENTFFKNFISLLEIMTQENNCINGNKIGNLVLNGICPILTVDNKNIKSYRYHRGSQQDSQELLIKIFEQIENEYKNNKNTPETLYNHTIISARASVNNEQLFLLEILQYDYKQSFKKFIGGLLDIILKYRKDKDKLLLKLYDFKNDNVVNFINNNYNEILSAKKLKIIDMISKNIMDDIKNYIIEKKEKLSIENLEKIHKRIQSDDYKKYNENYKSSMLPIIFNSGDNRSMEEIIIDIFNQEFNINKVSNGDLVRTSEEGKQKNLYFIKEKIVPNKYFIVHLKLFSNLKKKTHRIQLSNINGQIMINSTVYNLVAFIAHSGSIRGGHYVCYVKYGSKWFFYSDSHRSEISSNLGFDYAYKNNYDPYVILYEKA